MRIGVSVRMLTTNGQKLERIPAYGQSIKIVTDTVIIVSLYTDIILK